MMTEQPGIRGDAPNAALVVTQVGNRSYPLRSVANCHVCQHPNRNTIEMEIAKGRTYRAIWRGLSEDDQAQASPRNMADHYRNGHMGMDQTINRAIIEERAETVGRAIEEGVETLVDHVVVAKVIQQRGYERLVQGEIQPDVKETLAAAKFVHEIESGAAEQLDAQMLNQVFATYMAAARSVMSHEQMMRFGAILNAEPLLKSLDRRSLNGAVEDVIDVDPVVEG